MQQEAEAALRKAGVLKMLRREEYEKAQLSTNRSLEEQTNAANKQLEKKKRVEEEALQKVGGRDAIRHTTGLVQIDAVALDNLLRNNAAFPSVPHICSAWDRQRKPRSSTRAAWLTLASGRWIWPTLRTPSSHRYGRWSFSATSHSRL